MLKPLIELLIAASLWGFGFVATTWCLQSMAPMPLLFLRFLIATVIGGLFLLRFSLSQLKNEFLISLPAGFFLALNLGLQTQGLLTTSPTKSAFITTLYVIFVPIFSHFLRHERINPLHFVFVIGAILGTALIVDLQWTQWTSGDTYTLLNAVAGSFHIIYVGRVAKKSQSAFAFNVLQSFWTTLMVLPVVFFVPMTIPSLDGNQKFWVGLVSLSVGGSLIAFYLQVKAQRILSSSLSALLFLLESPMAMLFSFTLLGERLNAIQLCGAGMILISCVGAIKVEIFSRRLFKSLGRLVQNGFRKTD